MSGWFDRTFKPIGTLAAADSPDGRTPSGSPLSPVGTESAATNVHRLTTRERREDVRYLRSLLKRAEYDAADAYTILRGIAKDLLADGHTDAANLVSTASWRVKQAEALLLKAGEETKA